jgi:hypothetical protein
MSITAEDPITPSTTVTDVASPEPSAPGSSAPGSSAPGSVRRQRARRTPLSAAPRRTKVTVRRVGVASVLKLSLIFYLCLMLVLWLALLLIYLVLQAGGVIDTLSETLGDLFGAEQGTRGREPIAIDGTAVFTALFVIGLGWTVVMAGINMFIAVIYNLISDMVGGIDVTLSERR